MKSLNEYIRILTNPTPTEEDVRTRDYLMNFVSDCNDQMECLSVNTINFLIGLSSAIESVRMQNQEVPNAYFQSTLDTWRRITSSPSKLELRHMEEEKLNQKKEQMRLSKQKKDGFTNASILIYVALNLGLFLACLLLLFK